MRMNWKTKGKEKATRRQRGCEGSTQVRGIETSARRKKVRMQRASHEVEVDPGRHLEGTSGGTRREFRSRCWFRSIGAIQLPVQVRAPMVAGQEGDENP
jgi:hypothetical protein